MNASSLLKSQGWRGKGHSLHKTDDSIGLAKPLLLNRKDNTKGLGTTAHFTSDQWWMHAFDEQLKGLETNKDGKLTQTITTGKLNAIENCSLGKYSLHTSFVRGGLLQGTLGRGGDGDNPSDGTSEASDPDDRIEKMGREKAQRLKEDKAKEKAVRRNEKEEKRANKVVKRQRQEEQLSRSREGETKVERRARRAEKKRLKEEKEIDKVERRKNKEERRAKKEARRREQQRPAT